MEMTTCFLFRTIVRISLFCVRFMAFKKLEKQYEQLPLQNCFIAITLVWFLYLLMIMLTVMFIKRNLNNNRRYVCKNLVERFCNLMFISSYFLPFLITLSYCVLAFLHRRKSWEFIHLNLLFLTFFSWLVHAC